MSNTKNGGYKGAKWMTPVQSEKITMNSGMLYTFEIKYWRTPSHEFEVKGESYLHI